MGNTLQITFNPKIFGPLFNSLRKIEYSDKRFILMRGSRGSGKSHAIVQYLLYKTLKEKHRVAIIRKTSESLNDTVIKLIFDYMDQWGIRHLWEFNKMEKRFINRINGSEIMCKGLNKPERIKGLENTDIAWIEESVELSEEDFTTLNYTLRSKNQKIIMSFNPISKQSWLYKTFYESTHLKEETHYYKSTYKDNPFLDPQASKQLEILKNYNYSRYQVEGLGEWGNILTGQEMFKSFKPEQNCQTYKYDPELPIHISMDENVVPYLSGLCCQIKGKDVYIFKEYALEHPHNKIRSLTDYINKDFEGHKDTVFLYGDASSRARSAKIETDSNTFYMMLDFMKILNPQLRVPKSNPPVSKRCQWIDEIFFGLHEIKIHIDPSCYKLIDDLQNVKQDSDGSKFKHTVRHPTTKISYQEYGHMSDALEYLVVEAFRPDFEDFKSGGPIKIPRYDLKVRRY